MKRACENCLYWEEDSHSELGECRFNPPVPGSDEHFPQTYGEEWCGKFENKDSFETEMQYRKLEDKQRMDEYILANRAPRMEDVR